MDQEQQRLVRASFAKVAPIADTAAAMFYERLFATDPTLRSLFKGKRPHHCCRSASGGLVAP